MSILNEIKELKQKHGDLKLSELILILSDVGIESAKFRITKNNGRGCYECAGDTSTSSGTILDILGMSSIDLYVLEEDDSEEDYPLVSNELLEHLSSEIAGGGFGSSYYTSYKIEHIDKQFSHDEIYEYLKQFRISIGEDLITVSDFEKSFEW